MKWALKEKLMKTKFLNIALASMLLVVTNIANAGLITLNNSTEIGVLSLSESFKSFYDYRRSSSHTGYEQEATAVMFLAEHNGALALYTLLDASGTKHNKRTASLAISDFDLSKVLLVDDYSEKNKNGFRWKWVDCCTDGMIYEIDDVENFDIDLEFSNVSGFSDFKFLSFSDSGKGPVEFDISNSFSIQAVPEPTTLAIFAIGILGLASRRFKKTS